MSRSVFSELVLPPHAALVHVRSPRFCLNDQAAEVNQKNLEKEVAAFLSMLQNDELSESKTCYFTLNRVFFLYVIFSM